MIGRADALIAEQNVEQNVVQDICMSNWLDRSRPAVHDTTGVMTVIRRSAESLREELSGSE
jgi:hypothetical protein